MSGNEVNLSISSRHWPRRVFLFCLTAEILLVLLDAFVSYGRLIEFGPMRRLFNITREDGLATWFMVIQTFFAGLILWLIAVVQRARGAKRSNVISWALLSVFFIYMSADDAAEIHERLGSTFKALLQNGSGRLTQSLIGEAQGLFPSYDWQLIVLPFLICAGLLMVFFLLREFQDRNSRLILIFATGMMAAAVSLDFLEGLDEGHPLNLYSWIQYSYSLAEYTVSHFAKSLEEFLEMCSISLLLMLFLAHLLNRSAPRITIDFDS